MLDCIYRACQNTFMPRQARIHFPNAWYHVINRGVFREIIYFKNKHKKHFLYLLGKMSEKYNVQVHAYCLMHNHFHLIVHTPEGNITKAIHYLESAYVNWLNAEINREGPLFQGRFLSIVVDNDAYLTHLSRYIHMNPVKAGVTYVAEFYSWSSYQHYFGLRTPPEWLHTDTIMEYFNHDQGQYQRFVENTDDTDLTPFYAQNNLPPILGDEAFRQKIKDKLKYQNPKDPALKLKLFTDHYSFEQILEVVSCVYGTPKEHILEAGKYRRNGARMMFIYLCRKKSGLRDNQIAKYAGLKNSSSIPSSIARFESLLTQNEKINGFLEICLAKLSSLTPINLDKMMADCGL